MEVLSPGQWANGHPPASPGPAVITSETVVRYLTNILEVLLGASTEDLESKGSILSESKKNETVQRCTRFASESQAALYVQKDVISSDVPNGTVNGDASPGMSYTALVSADQKGAKALIQATSSTRCLRKFHFPLAQSLLWPFSSVLSL